ncbi:UNVERIFIED_CONTAM: hypothetical protein K2H54_048879 [Gekko kuhli]
MSASRITPGTHDKEIGGDLTCAEHLQAFQALAAELEVPLAAEKTEGPATRLTYLGIRLDLKEQFYTLAPEANLVSDPLPEELWDLGKLPLCMGSIAP